MAKSKTVYVCNDCGSEYAKWQGQCNDCQAWNTLSSLSVDAKPQARSGFAGQLEPPKKLSEVSAEELPRLETGIGELDRVLGLELGADDYVTKPFQPDEVIARVNTHLTVYRLKKALDQKNKEFY